MEHSILMGHYVDLDCTSISTNNRVDVDISPVHLRKIPRMMLKRMYSKHVKVRYRKETSRGSKAGHKDQNSTSRENLQELSWKGKSESMEGLCSQGI